METCEIQKYQKLLEQVIVEGNIDNINQAIEDLETKEHIDHCLSNVYHRLKLLNVPIDEDIESYVVDVLVSQRFFCDKKGDNLKPVPITLDNIHERIDRLVKLIDKLTTKFTGITMVKNLFVCMCRLTAKHLHILKYQLKSTYDKLPWAEMEFCFVTLVLNVVKPDQSDDVSKLVLHRTRILQHLDTFKKGLLKLKPELDSKCINCKVRLGNRTQIIQSVLAFIPEFEALYSDYDLIKDISSLCRIDNYILICRDLRFDGNVEQDKLVVERTLQVIGETLKSTPDSPNMSKEVQEMLVRSNGKNLKELLTALRDSLSHTESLFQKVDIENSNAPDFFQRVRDDLTKIHTEIVGILFKRRLKALEIFTKNVLQCKDLLEIRSLSENIDSFNDIVICDIGGKDLADVELLVEEMRTMLLYTLCDEKLLFDKIDRVIRDEKAKGSILLRNYTALTRSVRFAISEIRRSEDFGYIHQLFTLILEVLENSNDISTSLRSIGQPIVQIQKFLEKFDFELDEQLQHVMNDILHVAVYSSERSSHIDKFKTNLEHSYFTNMKHRRYIDGILDKVESFLKTESERVAFQKAVAAKKEVSQMRLELVTLVDKKLSESTEVDDETVMSLLQKFKLKKQNEEMFINNYTDGAYRDCMDTIKKIDDTYGVFIKNMLELDVFSYQKQQKALRTFLASLKLKKFALEDVMQDFITQSEAEIQRFIMERTNILKKILPAAGIVDVQGFVQEIRENKSFKVITELVLLDVLNVLEKMSLFVDDKLFLDDPSPLLLGKSLRNYLAHGNTLVDILPIDTDRILACNAFRILQVRERLLTSKDVLIGKRGSEELFKSKFYLEGFDDLAVQDLLYATVHSNKVDNIVDCLDEGAHIHGRDIHGQNALHFAASGDGLDSLLFCIKEGLNEFSVDISNQSALDLAVQNGSKRCLQYYLDHPHVNVDIDYVLITAAKFRQMDIVSMMLQQFCDNISTEAVVDTINFTSELGYIEILQAILEKFDENGEIRDVDAMHKACFYGHKPIVELLLSHEFDINRAMENGLLPIHSAIMGGHCDIVELLLKTGSQLDSDKHLETGDEENKVENAKEDPVLSSTAHLRDLVNLTTLRDATKCLERTSPALSTACTLNKPRIVEMLIKAGADVNQCSRERGTPLHQACECGAVEIVDMLLDNKAYVNSVMQGDITAAHCATRDGHLNVLEKLWSHRANLDRQTDKGKTPLHIAVALGHRHIVDFLVQKGVNVNTVDSDGYSPLHLVNHTGDASILDILLKQPGTKVDLQDMDGNTALHFAASYGNVACVELLLASGAKCDVANAVKVTPLLYAIEGGFAGIADLLLDHPVDVNVAYLGEHTPLHIASKNGLTDIVAKLLKLRAKVNMSDSRGVTPLHVAGSYGRAEVARILLQAGGEVNAQTKEGYTPLYLAAKEGHAPTMEVLCGAGADIEEAELQGITPLLVACSGGHRRAVELLLVRGANVGALDAAGASPMHVSALGGHLDVVRLLSEHGGLEWVHRGTDTGESVLHMACESGNGALVRYLLEKGAPVDAVDEGKYTPLHVAAEKCWSEIVELLLQAGAPADALAKGGATVLHMAQDEGNVAVVKALLKAGAPVGAILKDSGETALHMAARAGNVEVARVLVEAGAPLGVVDKLGCTPADAALSEDEVDVEELLLEAEGL